MSAPWFIPAPSFTAEEMPVHHEVGTCIRLPPYPTVTWMGPKFSLYDSYFYIIPICQRDYLYCFLLKIYLRLMTLRNELWGQIFFPKKNHLNFHSKERTECVMIVGSFWDWRRLKQYLGSMGQTGKLFPGPLKLYAKL